MKLFFTLLCLACATTGFAQPLSLEADVDSLGNVDNMPVVNAKDLVVVMPVRKNRGGAVEMPIRRLSPPAMNDMLKGLIPLNDSTLFVKPDKKERPKKKPDN